MNTSQITVRNVDPVLKRRIAKLAKLKAMSINDFVLESLRTKVGMTPAEGTINWQSYSGTMDRDGINQAVLDDFEAIDTTMWK